MVSRRPGAVACVLLSDASVAHVAPLPHGSCRYSQIKLNEARQAASAKLNLPQAVSVEGGFHKLSPAPGGLRGESSGSRGHGKQHAQPAKERASPVPPRGPDSSSSSSSEEEEGRCW